MPPLQQHEAAELPHAVCTHAVRALPQLHQDHITILTTQGPLAHKQANAHLQPLHGREARVRVLPQLDGPRLERLDAVAHVDSVLLCHCAHLQSPPQQW